MRIPRVTLELVRQGPPHNQLLSPLTPYFAICGNHEPEIVHVPFEHATLLRKLQTLRYERSDAAAEISADAEDVRRALVEMLCSIRSLQRELTSTARGGARRVALELVISAYELSILPFELVFRPGVPTRELAASEVVVLRRTRRVPATAMRWPIRPRVLFAYAGDVPYERHLLALRECLDPWLKHSALLDPADATRELKKYVTVVADATLPKIHAAFEERARDDQEFTHAHLLAHGALRDNKFGLLLRRPSDPSREGFVTGESLASALTSTASDGSRVLPACVTLAACDSGNVGDVTYVGSAVAHELHEGGIAFVVASQFPLTFHGSAAMVRELYGHLLLVDDPQVALAEMRNAVRAWSGETKGQLDWASFVAYGALPRDLARQVARGRIEQAKRAVESAIGMVDPFVNNTNDRVVEAPTDPQKARETLDAANQARIEATRMFEKAAEGAERAWYLGAVLKRWAETWMYWLPKGDAPPGVPRRDEWKKYMRQAAERYLEAFVLTGAPAALVQSLACNLFADPHDADAKASAPVDRSPKLQWNLAADLLRLRSQRRSDGLADGERAVLELWLMAPLVFPEAAALATADERLREELDGDPRALLDAECSSNAPQSFERYSLLRQARRFIELPSRDAPGHKEARARATWLRDALVEGGALERWTAVMDYRRSPSGPVSVESE